MRGKKIEKKSKKKKKSEGKKKDLKLINYFYILLQTFFACLNLLYQN